MPPLSDNQIAGLVLKTLRRGARLPQHRIASALGWPQSRICKIELGIRELSVPELIRISRLLDLSPAEMIEGIEAALDLKKLRPIQARTRSDRRFVARTD